MFTKKKLANAGAFATIEPGNADQLREEVERGRSAEPRLRDALQRALEEFIAGKRDQPAVGRFAMRVARALEEIDWPASVGAKRQKIVGAYFEEMVKCRRSAGRPRLAATPLFEWMATRLDQERLAEGKDVYARIPAQKIAQMCAREGYGDFSTDAVRKALTGRKKAIGN